MKKIHSILLGMGLITGGLMLAGWTSGETVTLEEIDTATQTEQLLKNHSSFQITSVYVDDDFTWRRFSMAVLCSYIVCASSGLSTSYSIVAVT